MHFFIDQLESFTQTLDDKYGAVNGNSSTLYNVTSRFQLTNYTRAYACQNGHIIVQQSDVDDSLVNIILKPSEKLDIPLKVKYYLYRGILKSSLIDPVLNSIILPSSGSNNDLLKRIWKTPPKGSSSYGSHILGYSSHLILPLPSNTKVESIFNNLTGIVKSIYVKEGEWFGDFTKDYKIGFEVILENDRLNIDLNYLKAEKYRVDVTNLNGLALRNKREEVLCFIDPAALFGMHHYKGLMYSTKILGPVSGGNPKSTIEKNGNSTINKTYSLLISKFDTRNRVYIDIRSERGYSYNFYKNYEDTNNNSIKIGFGNNNPVAQKYESFLDSGWPILYIEGQQINSITKNDVRLNLRINDNSNPIIYAEDKRVLTEKADPKEAEKKSNFIREKKIKNGTSIDWSNELVFYFPNTVVSGNTRNNVAYYIKLYYFRQKHNTISPASVLKNIKYFDSAFCPIDFDLNTPNKFIINPDFNYIREPLQVDGTGNFQHSATSGAYWDNNRILFYSALDKKEINKLIDDSSGKKYIYTDGNTKQFLNIINNYYKSSLLKKSHEVICRQYVKPGLGAIKILGLNYYSVGDGTDKENLILLGLTISEITAIKNATGLSANHHRYIYLEPNVNNPLRDGGATDGAKFFEYTVKVQGLNDSENAAFITPLLNGSPILVYSRDNQLFASKAYSDNATVTPGINRIEYHIYHNGKIKINDNLDLSLLHDATLPAEADPVLEKRIYYIYHNATNQTFEVCNLQILQINRMGTGSPNSANFPNFPTGWTQFVDYTAPPVVDGVDAKQSYRNANGDVVTNGLKYGNANYKIFYKKHSKKVFIVHLEAFNFAALDIGFTYTETKRYYCRPDLVAAFIGALVDIANYVDEAPTVPFNIVSTGSCFKDGTSFPSLEHNNGFAIDTKYQKNNPGLTQAQELARDQAFVNAMGKYGCKEILRGIDTYSSQLDPPAGNGGKLHDTHLHCGELTINK